MTWVRNYEFSKSTFQYRQVITGKSGKGQFNLSEMWDSHKQEIILNRSSIIRRLSEMNRRYLDADDEE